MRIVSVLGIDKLDILYTGLLWRLLMALLQVSCQFGWNLKCIFWLFFLTS